MSDFVGELRVSPEELENAAKRFYAELTNMQTCFDQMKLIMNASVGYWNGVAGDAHRLWYQEQTDMTEEMIRRYQEHVADLNRMAGVYMSAEQTAQQTAEQLPTVDF